MIRNFLSDLTTVTLTKSLDVAGLRHRVIANNIANVETPGFIRSDVSFEGKLRQALESANEESAQRYVQDIRPEVQEDVTSPIGPNGSNVSIDKEMADLTENTLQYEALTRLLNMKLAMLTMVITEGKR